MKILLHTCCGPCTIYPLEKLRQDQNQVYGYFYNPNIHPFTEWQKRKEALGAYAEQKHFKVIMEDDYDLEYYLRQVVYREATRCRFCYDLRLRRTAQIARRGNFDAFTTTLLVSPFQKHDLIRETGLAIGEEMGIPFYYEDFRPGYQEATSQSRLLGMYRQQYCGCIYSEKDRYSRKKKK